MIYNFWVWMDTGFADEVRAKFALNPPPPSVQGSIPSIASVAATTYPLINSLDPTLPKLFKGRAKLASWDVWNCYIDVDDLSDIVPLRGGLRKLEEIYPDDFIVLGAWDWGGAQIGHVPLGVWSAVGRGVGHTWFPKPPNILDFMPDNVLQDVILLAGQAERQFT